MGLLCLPVVPSFVLFAAVVLCRGQDARGAAAEAIIASDIRHGLRLRTAVHSLFGIRVIPPAATAPDGLHPHLKFQRKFVLRISLTCTSFAIPFTLLY